jgi:hypothetical protein
MDSTKEQAEGTTHVPDRMNTTINSLNSTRSSNGCIYVGLSVKSYLIEIQGHVSRRNNLEPVEQTLI